MRGFSSSDRRIWPFIYGQKDIFLSGGKETIRPNANHGIKSWVQYSRLTRPMSEYVSIVAEFSAFYFKFFAKLSLCAKIFQNVNKRFGDLFDEKTECQKSCETTILYVQYSTYLWGILQYFAGVKLHDKKYILSYGIFDLEEFEYEDSPLQEVLLVIGRLHRTLASHQVSTHLTRWIA
jgi:hypothetical protein